MAHGRSTLPQLSCDHLKLAFPWLRGLRTAKVGWSAAPKNQILTVRPKLKPDLVQGGPTYNGKEYWQF